MHGLKLGGLLYLSPLSRLFNFGGLLSHIFSEQKVAVFAGLTYFKMASNLAIQQSIYTVSQAAKPCLRLLFLVRVIVHSIWLHLHSNIYFATQSIFHLKLFGRKKIMYYAMWAPIKVQMKCFFYCWIWKAEKIRKIAVYRFLISLLVPELRRFKNE